MAYPILIDIYRAQVVMQGISGLPEDQFVNNWYFRNDAPGVPSGAIERVLNAFYDQINGTATITVRQRLQGITAVSYKIYDLGQAPPRYPVVPPITASWVNGSQSNALPRETALCLSFKGGPGPRQRGRVYIGPLSDLTVDNTTTGPRPDEDFELALMESARNVMNTSEPVTWVVASPTGASTVVVNEGWVDNAFDTQRSRGLAPSIKRRFDSSGVDI